MNHFFSHELDAAVNQHVMKYQHPTSCGDVNDQEHKDARKAHAKEFWVSYPEFVVESRKNVEKRIRTLIKNLPKSFGLAQYIVEETYDVSLESLFDTSESLNAYFLVIKRLRDATNSSLGNDSLCLNGDSH